VGEELRRHRPRRTLSGEEIDNVIATTLVRLELAAEQARRKWTLRRRADA